MTTYRLQYKNRLANDKRYTTLKTFDEPPTLNTEDLHNDYGLGEYRVVDANGQIVPCLYDGKRRIDVLLAEEVVDVMNNIILEEPVLVKTQRLIAEECDAVKELLLAKNREYGNSAMEPIGVFSHLDPVKQIEVRIDDKLKRLQTTRQMDDVKIHEDTEQDLIGYLVLLRVVRRMLSER
jgi:hypothetical protein